MLRVLGPLEAERDGRALALGGPQQRALLAVLAVHAGELVPGDRLMEDLWGEPLPPRAAKRLQVAVTRLRHALEGDGAIVNEAGGYRLELERDADRFERLVDEGRLAQGELRVATLG